MEKFNDAQIVELIVSQITIYTISIILESQVATVWILEQKLKLLNPCLRLASFSQDYKSFWATDLYHNVNFELLDNLHPTPHVFNQLALILSKSYFLLLIALIVYSLVLTIPKHNEPFRFNTSTICQKDNDRFEISYQNSYIKSVGSINVNFMNKIILVLAHSLHWGYIVNPEVLAAAFLMVK